MAPKSPTRISKEHAAILAAVRERAKDGSDPATTARLDDIPDRDLLRLLFSNLRTVDGETRGMRLTQFGLTVLLAFWRAFDQKVDKEHAPVTADILYLDSRATMPYFCSKDRVVVFETKLGVELRLADGVLATLRGMSGSGRPRGADETTAPETPGP